MSVTRRCFFQSSAAILGGAGLAGLASRQAYAAKMAQSDVKYQDSPKDGHNCAGCALFQPPNACQAVDGTISPNGWCTMWVAKS